jgi:hypothetical protein
MDDGILARVPAVQADPLLVQDLHYSTRAHWLTFVQMMTQPEPEVVFPHQAEDFVRSVARRRLELGVVLKVYRAGNIILWNYFTDLIDDLPPDGPTRDETLVFLWTRGGIWLDESIERVTEIYYNEQAQALESRIAGKIETVDALLKGLPVREDASRALGHALSQCQTAFVVWLPEGQSEATRIMQDVARALGKALGVPRPFTIPRSSRDLWCWAATPRAPDLAAALKTFEPIGAGEVRVAIGSPARGEPGFRTSNAEARAVQRLVMSAPNAPAVVRYDEVELLCLTNGDSDAFRRMVRRELKGLAGDARGVDQVRKTLYCYLTSGANVDAAAARLHVHRNTVHYRLNRAEELMGHPITERVGHVELALRYVNLFGSPPDSDDVSPAAPRRRSPAVPTTAGARRTP